MGGNGKAWGFMQALLSLRAATQATKLFKFYSKIEPTKLINFKHSTTVNQFFSFLQTKISSKLVVYGTISPEGTNSALLFTSGERKALAKSKVHH